MSGSLRLGKILGIEIRIHYSWLIIFALVSFYIYSDFRDLSNGIPISLLMGVAASLLLFACVVAHELAHSIVAMRNGIPVRSITLFILGGVANMTKEAERPKIEMLMAIAGPLCSLALGLILGAIWLVTGGLHNNTTAYQDLLFWLATLNLGLGVFNLLPGFPMDGGRVLRAILWQTTKDFKKASRIASVVGQVMGWSMAGVGVGITIAYFTIKTSPLGLDYIDGIWFAVMGWFLSSLAASSYRQVEWHEAMRGVTATSAMVTDFMSISPSTNLKQVVEEYVMPNRYRSFVVASEGKLQGMVTIADIRRVPQGHWDITTADAVMTPASKMTSVTPGEEGLNILEKMEKDRLDEIPVVKASMVIGIVTRNNLIRLMQLRTPLDT
jgi:Zn-dependent protease/CBS domain-containing protein